MTSDPRFPGEFPNLGELMQQAQKMQEELLRSQSQLAQKTVDASAGGGMVTVTLSGSREVLSLHIDPQAIDPKDPQMLQDLIVAALNQGLQKIRQLEEEEMRKTASGLGLPNGLL